MELRFISDAGHGWLEVPRADIMASGVVPSQYSYVDMAKDLVYLEEDCDAPKFIKAAGLDIKDIRTTYNNGSAACRGFHSYSADRVERLIGCCCNV